MKEINTVAKHGTAAKRSEDNLRIADHPGPIASNHTT